MKSQAMKTGQPILMSFVCLWHMETGIIRQMIKL